MIKAFTYRTELSEKEFTHTIYADSITDSVTHWVDHLKDLKNEVYSFDQKSVESIEMQFKNGKIKLKQNPNILVYQLNDKYQITYINENKKLEPDFIAQLEFMTTKNGGRKGCAYSGYRPIFKLTNKNEMTSANLIFNNKQKVFPGEKTIALINIFWIEKFESLLYPELEFELLEPPRIIAKGKIIEIMNKKLSKTSTEHHE